GIELRVVQFSGRRLVDLGGVEDGILVRPVGHVRFELAHDLSFARRQDRALILARRSRAGYGPNEFNDSCDDSDPRALLDHVALVGSVLDRARRWCSHLRVDLVHSDLSDELPLVDVVPVLGEPCCNSSLCVRRLRQLRKSLLGHFCTCLRIASLILPTFGRAAYSSGRAYGIGTSGFATRDTGERSMEGSCSTIRAVISPVSPKD